MSSSRLDVPDVQSLECCIKAYTHHFSNSFHYLQHNSSPQEDFYAIFLHRLKNPQTHRRKNFQREFLNDKSRLPDEVEPRNSREK